MRSKPWHTVWDKNVLGWRRWNVATWEMKVCDMEVKIVTFVVKGSVQLTAPPPRSTGVNQSRKQRCSSPSWSLSQRDTSNIDYSQNLDYWLTKRHRCICMWSWTEMLTFSSQLRVKTPWNPLLMSTEICRLGEGHNLWPLECRLSMKNSCPQRNSNPLSLAY